MNAAMHAVLSRQMGAHLSRVVRSLCAVDKGRGLYRPLIKDYATDAEYFSGLRLGTSNASRSLSGKCRPLSAFDVIDASLRILRRVHKVLLAEPQWHTSHRIEAWSARYQRRSDGRMGNTTASTGRCSDVQEVVTNEANDETRSLGELNRQANEMALETDSHSPVTAFWYSFGTVETKNEKVE